MPRGTNPQKSKRSSLPELSAIRIAELSESQTHPDLSDLMGVLSISHIELSKTAFSPVDIGSALRGLFVVGGFVTLPQPFRLSTPSSFFLSASFIFRRKGTRPAGRPVRVAATEPKQSRSAKSESPRLAGPTRFPCCGRGSLPSRSPASSGSSKLFRTLRESSMKKTRVPHPRFPGGIFAAADRSFPEGPDLGFGPRSPSLKASATRSPPRSVIPCGTSFGGGGLRISSPRPASRGLLSIRRIFSAGPRHRPFRGSPACGFPARSPRAFPRRIRPFSGRLAAPARGR